MTTTDNSQRIRNCYNRISQCENRINVLQTDIATLKSRRAALAQGRIDEKNCQKDFINSVANEKAKIKKVQTLSNVKIATGYSDNMGQFFNSSVYSQAEDAYVKIIALIDNAIQAIDDEIREKQLQVSNFRSEINALRYEIRTL